MKCVDHLHLGIDDDGEPVALFLSYKDANDAIDADDLQREEIVDVVPDVPILVDQLLRDHERAEQEHVESHADVELPGFTSDVDDCGGDK